MPYHPSIKEDGILTTIPDETRELILKQLSNNQLKDITSNSSSVALAVNTFGYFCSKVEELPNLSDDLDVKWEPKYMEFQVNTYIPKRRGFPPHADIIIELPDAIVGIVSKRYEQFCGIPELPLSDVYWDLSVGNHMQGYCRIRDGFTDKSLKFKCLKVCQLFKFALGIRSVTYDGEIKNSLEISDVTGKKAILLYLYTEPDKCNRTNKPISKELHNRHREEIKQFADIVTDDEVQFISLSYQELLESWRQSTDEKLRDHANLIAEVFTPYPEQV